MGEHTSEKVKSKIKVQLIFDHHFLNVENTKLKVWIFYESLLWQRDQKLMFLLYFFKLFQKSAMDIVSSVSLSRSVSDVTDRNFRKQHLCQTSHTETQQQIDSKEQQQIT